MSPSRILSAVAVLLATASATFTSPSSNTSWDVNTAHQIEWDTAGLEAPLTMHLAPVGAIDISSYIATLAPSIPNTGSWTWQPTTSIPQHYKSVTIIIIDSGGHHQMSPPVQLAGWPQLLHTSIAAPVYTPPPMVHTATVAPVYTVTPVVHTSIMVHTPVVEIIAPIHTSVEIIAPVHTVVSAVESAIVVTSLWIAPIVHTSQPAAIIITHSLPPILQTENVAPILVTQTQEPITKIVTQAALISTEYPAPIVKTILVTETQAPILHNISQPALTVVETMAPVVATESQAPIVKTLTQEPSIVTEVAAPVLVTWQETKTHLITSHIIVTPAHTIVVETIAPVVHTPLAPMYTPIVVVHTPEPMAVHSTLIIVHTSAAGAEPIFTNTTAIPILSPTFTTPAVAMLVTDSGAVGTGGAGSLQPTFVPNSASKEGASYLLASMAVGLVMLLF